FWMGRQPLQQVADIWLLGPADNRPNPCGTQFPHPKGGRPFCDRLSPLIAIRKPRPPIICMRRSDKKAYHPSPDRVIIGKCAAFAGSGSASLTKSTASPLCPMLACILRLVRHDAKRPDDPLWCSLLRREHDRSLTHRAPGTERCRQQTTEAG